MEVKESYRILELEIGASRDEVDAAYFRLIERWHPDRAASGGPEAVREAQRMVQAINEAHQTLSKIVPSVTRPPVPAPAPPPTRAVPPPSSVTTPPTGMKPRIAPLSTGQPDLNSPPPKPPPADTWASRSAPVAGAPTPPTPASPPAPVASARPAPPPAKPVPPAPAASAPPPAPTPEPVAAASVLTAEQPATFIDRLKKAAELYDQWFPVGTARRRYGHIVIAGTLILLLLLGKCAFSSHRSKGPREPDPKTTGRLVVKSNLADTTIEATRIATPDDATITSFNGLVDQPLAGLPPGKYNVKARAEGWPEIHQEVTVDVGRATEIAMNFKGGSLRLDSDPTGASVRQGDSVLGRTPLVIPQLPPGECQLFLEYPSLPALSFKATIAEGVESTATVRLPHGKLTVETSPTGVKVLLGKRLLGQTPLTLELFPAGTRKLTLQAKDFPALELSVTVDDGGEAKVHPALGTAFPVLDPSALLHAVWVPDSADSFAAPFEGLSGPSAPQNGVIKNLNRKRLYEDWLRKRYCLTAVVKGYDRTNGQIEFAEQKSELSSYRVLARLSAEARNDQALTAQLTKGATFAFYGRLNAVEEPRFLSKVISFEFSSVEPLR